MSLTIEINDTELLKEIENCTFDTTFFHTQHYVKIVMDFNSKIWP